MGTESTQKWDFPVRKSRPKRLSRADYARRRYLRENGLHVQLVAPSQPTHYMCSLCGRLVKVGQSCDCDLQPEAA